MISFYPGPSRIHNRIPKYVSDAAKEGILSANHRSEAFVQLSQKTIELLHAKLDVPPNYTILFTSSATECWEIIAQSVIREKSYHLYNGAFGQKWFDYTQRLRSAEALPFGTEESLEPTALTGFNDVICITQNETSNGTQVSNVLIKALRQNNPDAILAVDATSSLAGIKLSYKSADIWFASVQKCFGLPAGLGLMICAPRAIAQALQIGEKSHYNSLGFMVEMMNKWQTSFTPNVLAIYMLMRVMDDSPAIAEVHKKTLNRYKAWTKFLSERASIKMLIDHRDVRSYTVIPVTSSAEIVEQVKSEAKEIGLLLGEGYGAWKPNTFRIANFPALKKKEIKKLMKFLEKF
ncbi:MAG: aminotransferase class V-fold PLP-dependent enzyme [Chryseolinea sp.]